MKKINKKKNKTNQTKKLKEFVDFKERSKNFFCVFFFPFLLF